MSSWTCDLAAIPASERAAHQELTRHLIQSATEIRESGEGFTLQLAATEYDAVTRFVARERLCCPFLSFTVDVLPGHGGVELVIQGPSGAKDFMRAELDLVVR